VRVPNPPPPRDRHDRPTVFSKMRQERYCYSNELPRNLGVHRRASWIVGPLSQAAPFQVPSAPLHGRAVGADDWSDLSLQAATAWIISQSIGAVPSLSRHSAVLPMLPAVIAHIQIDWAYKHTGVATSEQLLFDCPNLFQTAELLTGVIQRFDRSYGSLWQQSILVDADPTLSLSYPPARCPCAHSRRMACENDVALRPSSFFAVNRTTAITGP